MSALFILTLSVLSFTAGTIVGWVVGERRGRDSQWCDDKFRAWADDRARRDARGRFSRKQCKLICERNECGNTEKTP